MSVSDRDIGVLAGMVYKYGAAEVRRAVTVASKSPLSKREKATSDGPCLHPVNRRIGDSCAVCGASLKAGKK